MKRLIHDLCYAYTGYRTFKKLHQLGLVRKEYDFITIFKAIRDKQEVKDEEINGSESTI